MNYKYDKNSLKENLSIEEVFELVNELGGEPKMMTENIFTAKTICHNLNTSNASRKLYYYNNTHLFHCYTECGDASFDIYDLVLKINKNMGFKNFTLSNAVAFVARYFGYNSETFDLKEDIKEIDDWKILNAFKKNKEKTPPQKVELKTYDNKILKYLPRPHILPWENENISYEISQKRGICYDPVNLGIVIPHYDINNNLIGIRERTLIKEEEKYGKYKPAVLNGKMYNHPLSFSLYNLNWSKDNIKKIHKAIVYEGEKSCLKHASLFGEENDISVACCGSNLIGYQIKMLLSLNVDEIIIALDKQFQEIGDIEWQKWTTKLKIIYNKFGAYVNISFIFDKWNLLDYKDSPIDKTKEIFTELFKRRVTIE